MGMNEKSEPIEEEQYQNAIKAAEELARSGKTDRRCLRCGGRFVYQEYGAGAELRCEECDFKLTFRGI